MIRATAVLAIAACAGGDAQPPPRVCATTSGMGVVRDHDVPCDPGGNGVLVTMSGEQFALTGYAFPPVSRDDVFLVDGWAIDFERVLTTIDHVTLARDPDKSPSDQSQCDDGRGGQTFCGDPGSVVAELDGPFAMDLHAGGPLAGADGGAMQAAAVGAFTGQNQLGNVAFDAATPYAFDFAVVPASTNARNVNLDAAALADYQTMIASSYTVMFVGTASWRGTSCTATGTYDFTALPTTVHFRFGLSAPTIYRNAQNPALSGMPFPQEEHPRGVQTAGNTSTIAQVTLHLDHLLWESFVHDSPAHFDPFAARYAGMGSSVNAVLEDYRGYGFQPFIDAQGHAVPWRSCVDAAIYTPPGTGAMAFDTVSVPVNALGNPAQVIRDFWDYTRYNVTTFGHLNADGLAFVDRQYPSPP
jgi:hypothetical protein